ncbi:hypothetical protein BC827DRAFT_1272393 [Russula dissimulans]|nr:hypothetical protein BC827DRAFT_1272393 [Russula dissimulans]
MPDDICPCCLIRRRLHCLSPLPRRRHRHSLAVIVTTPLPSSSQRSRHRRRRLHRRHRHHLHAIVVAVSIATIAAITAISIAIVVAASTTTVAASITTVAALITAIAAVSIAIVVTVSIAAAAAAAISIVPAPISLSSPLSSTARYSLLNALTLLFSTLQYSAHDTHSPSKGLASAVSLSLPPVSPVCYPLVAAPISLSFAFVLDHTPPPPRRPIAPFSTLRRDIYDAHSLVKGPRLCLAATFITSRRHAGPPPLVSSLRISASFSGIVFLLLDLTR